MIVGNGVETIGVAEACQVEPGNTHRGRFRILLSCSTFPARPHDRTDRWRRLRLQHQD